MATALTESACVFYSGFKQKTFSLAAPLALPAGTKVALNSFEDLAGASLPMVPKRMRLLMSSDADVAAFGQLQLQMRFLFADGSTYTDLPFSSQAIAASSVGNLTMAAGGRLPNENYSNSGGISILNSLTGLYGLFPARGTQLILLSNTPGTITVQKLNIVVEE